MESQFSDEKVEGEGHQPSKTSINCRISSDDCKLHALSRTFAIKRSVQISPHLKGVATLPCEILVYKNRIDRKHGNGRPCVRTVKRM